MLEKRWKPQEAEDSLERLRTVVKHVSDRLLLGDPRLVPPDVLAEMEPAANALGAQLAEYVENKTTEQRLEANNTADRLLEAAINLPTVPIRSTTDVLARAARAFVDETASSEGRIREQTDGATSAIQAARESLEALVAEFRAEVNRRANEFREHLEGRTSHVDEKMDGTVAAMAESEGRIREVAANVSQEVQTISTEIMESVRNSSEQLEREVTSTQEVFRATQEERAKGFTATQASRAEIFDNQATEIRERFDSNARETTGKANVLIAQLETHEEQAAKILESVAGAGTAGQYVQERDRQRSAADRWRLFGIVGLLLVIGARVAVFAESWMNPKTLTDSFTALIGKTTMLLSLAAFATYLLKQSGHHRAREEDTGRLANELMLIWPFVINLPLEERNQLLTQIIPAYFRGGLANHDPGDQVGMFEGAGRRNKLTDLLAEAEAD
jgi:hypothetical protein